MAQDGKAHKSDARQWVKDEKAKAPLAIDWVFAGSELYEDPATKKQVYAADEGDLITVANFGSAILDLPIASSAERCRPRVRHKHRENPPARHRGLCHAWSPAKPRQATTQR